MMSDIILMDNNEKPLRHNVTGARLIFAKSKHVTYKQLDWIRVSFRSLTSFTVCGIKGQKNHELSK